jgi:2-polyprenyl-6-methoxyphenol hydroxylase-like FAD-dependent oxidoreductase
MIDFQTKISAIDFSMRSLRLSTGECVKYDLLLGCDGVNSIVRRSLQTYSALPSLNSFKTEEILLPWQFKVMVQPIPPTLESDAIHAFPDMSRFFAKPQQPDQSSQGFSLFAIPTINQQLATVINWKRDDTPSFLNHSNLSDVTPELQREVEELFERQYPSFGKPSLEAVGQLVCQRASNIRKVRCNCYHNTEARVALVGDAVHATDATWVRGNDRS